MQLKWITGTSCLPGFVYEYEGVDGLKTGTTEFAGHCFHWDSKRMESVSLQLL